MTFPGTLTQWLDYIERIHPKTIDMGLDRARRVCESMGMTFGMTFAGPIITVGGTNGKGSTCAMLESILLAAGYRVGLYTSPHLLRYNERIRVNGQEVVDAQLCEAFVRVESARASLAAAGTSVALTYFEFGTLAAWDGFARASLDVLILEVGLGGRLDAVNIFDADAAIVTSIDLDHMDYLGDTRESIGREKAGIFRAGKPAIVSDPVPPASIVAHAHDIGADLQLIGRDFGYQGDRQQWQFWGRSGKRPTLAYPALRGANQLLNASAALAALDCLRERLPVGMNHIRLGLATVELPGRFQVLPGRPAVVLDVAHNPHAAAVLSENLSNMGFFPDTHAVFSMLADKDIAAVCRALSGRFSAWHVAPLPGPRGRDAANIEKAILDSKAGGTVACYASARDGYAAARRLANENDRIVVFGSFLTVADVMEAIQAENAHHRDGPVTP